jgi:hypothetical protein
MGVFSGKYGAVNGVSTVRNWVLNEVETPAEFRASNTISGTGRRQGIYDYNGSFEGFGGAPPAMPGEYFDFVGFTAPSSGVYGTTGETKEVVNAIVEQVTVNWNWRTAELLNWSLSFAAGEPLAIDHITGIISDPTIPDTKKMCGLFISINDQDWDNLVSATLNITSRNPSFVNSSTACRTGRRPGIIDWNLSVVEEARTPFNLFGGDHDIKLYTDIAAYEYWRLLWGRFTGTTDIRVDADTGDIISMTENFLMNGLRIIDGAEGVIGLPGEDGTTGGEYWWPTRVKAAALAF